MAEGTVVFPDEPMLEVTGPVIEAQLLETALLNICHLQSVLASKAARVTIAARGRRPRRVRAPAEPRQRRRAQGGALRLDRGMRVHQRRARGTPLRAFRSRVPWPTRFVTAFGDELEAFRAYARAFPDTAVLLIDSYDTLEGARKAVDGRARELAALGPRASSVCGSTAATSSR